MQNLYFAFVESSGTLENHVLKLSSKSQDHFGVFVNDVFVFNFIFDFGGASDRDWMFSSDSEFYRRDQEE